MKIWAGVFLSLLASVAECSEWIFVTPFGQQFKYSFNAAANTYSFSAADVTVNVPSCESDEFEVCVISNYLDLVIPRKPLNVGDKWSFLGSEFEYLQLLPELTLWGSSQKNIMMLSVLKDYSFYDGVEEKKRSIHLYSRDYGLLYVKDERAEIPLIATTLPSIGARPRE